MEHNPAELAGGVAIDGEGGSAAATVCAAGAGRAARGVLGRGQWHGDIASTREGHPLPRGHPPHPSNARKFLHFLASGRHLGSITPSGASLYVVAILSEGYLRDAILFNFFM